MNRNRNPIGVFVLYLFALVAQQLPAQQQGVGTVVGEVSGLPALATNYQVEIRAIMGGVNSINQRTVLETTGRFQFWRVAAGQYEFVVIDDHGSTLVRELIAVGDQMGPVQLRVRAQNGQRSQPKPRGTISLSRLQHKPPKAANKAYGRAGARRRKGQNAEAESAYLEAITIDPQFVEAINDLGTLYYAMGRYAESLARLDDARRIDPDAPSVLANTSAALMALGRPAEAEPLARRAVAGEPQSLRSRYLLGLSRAAQRKFDRETIELLEESAGAIPQARLALAHGHMMTGNRDAARGQIEKYLETGRTEQRSQAEGWLKSLR